MAGLLCAAGAAAGDSPGLLPKWLPFRPLSQSSSAQRSEKTLHFKREPVVGSDQEIQPTQAIIPAAAPMYGRPKKDEDDSGDFQVHTELPGPERLYRLDSEKEFFERLRQEGRKRLGSERVAFPEETPLTKEFYIPRQFCPCLRFVEPIYVCHRRLTFEQNNFERAGWDLGFFQPAVSLGVFYWDVATLPYQLLRQPCQRYDTSVGKCLPGDPEPMLLFPP